jgi:hypothetical protein
MRTRNTGIVYLGVGTFGWFLSSVKESPEILMTQPCLEQVRFIKFSVILFTHIKWRMALVWSTEFVLCVLLWRAEQWIRHLQGRSAHQADRSSQKYSRITFCSDHHWAFFLLSNLWQKSKLFFRTPSLNYISQKGFSEDCWFLISFFSVKSLTGTFIYKHRQV